MDMPRTITAEETTPIILGKPGENQAQQVIFDITPWIETFGEGECTLLHQGTEQDSGYLCPVVQQGSQVIWTVRQEDIAAAAEGGRCELCYTVGQVRVKSVVFSTAVEEGLVSGDTPPAPWQDWMDEVQEIAWEIRRNMIPDFHLETNGHLTVTVGEGEAVDLGSVKGATGAKGSKGDKGDTGDPGYTPQKGTDYFTPAEVDAVAACAADMVRQDDALLCWSGEKTYASGAVTNHNGFLWKNTSGASTTGTEPGTDYNVWNVTYCNRNLLDNPRLTVNQRGWSSGSVGGEYTVDRWKTFVNYATTGTFQMSGGEMVISNGGDDNRCGIVQYFETPLTGMTATFSARVSGTGRMIFAEGGSYRKTKAFEDADGIVSVTFAIGDYHIDRICLFADAGETLTVSEVKVEQGTVSTLVNEPPADAGQELLKCQRYFYRLVGTSYTMNLGVALAVSSTRLLLTLQMPVPMRDFPTVTASGGDCMIITPALSGDTEAKVSTSVSNVNSGSTRYRTVSVYTTGLTKGTPYNVLLAPGGYLDFSAEL